MNPYLYASNPWSSLSHFFGFLALFLVIDIALKAMALWRAARRGQKWWFIFLLIINSLGILPVIYLLTHPDIVKSAKK